ncbi:laccase [Chiua virens]|nr:laccase [Chiua virens]
MAWFGSSQVALPDHCFPVHPSIGPIGDLPIVNAIVSPDGFPKSAILAGNTLPGPIIAGRKGDNFLINVTNYLTDDTMLMGTTIHWHGISQHNHNQMDGSAYVTQCPIAPGNSFLYNFTAEHQVGTFWYHSHYGAQYCDGLRGPLIIYDPDDPYRLSYDVDDDSTIITLMDWYHVPSPRVHRQVFPASVLINGVGCYNNACENPHAIINVEPKKRYRFRLLNMACKPNYVFSIDGHTMTVIEVDGNYVKPYTVDSIQVHAAQRYSFILHADQHPDNYWVHAVPNQPVDATTRAILKYANAPSQLPKDNAQPAPQNPLNESLLRSLAPPVTRLLQAEPDVKLHLEMGKNMSDFNFLINGAQYTPPTIPILLQILSGAVSPWQVEPRSSVYTLPKDQIIEITFSAKDSPGRPDEHIRNLSSTAPFRGHQER